MRHSKETLILLALSVVAAISAWLWWPLEASSALPSAEVVASQEQVISSRKQEPFVVAGAKADGSEWARRNASRQDSSDAESVTQEFKEANDCRLYHTARHELSPILNDDRISNLSEESLAILEDIDATSSRYLSIARQTEGFCAGSDPDSLAQVYADTILEAALLGSADAESCFVISSIYPGKVTSSDLQAYFDNRYLKYAPAFMQNALKRGDPYVAAYALYRQLPPLAGHTSVLDDLPKADPYLTVQMAHLALLRALPEQRAGLEYRLMMFGKMGLLQPEEFKDAQAWALEEYERNFAGEPPINLLSPGHCYSSPDLAP